MTEANHKSDGYCENCGKPLFGRTDKRFCNDGCRNTFNRNKAYQQRAEVHENVPEILKIIRNNYLLLKAIGGPIDEDCVSFFNAKLLADEGFNFSFCTSVLQEEGILWRFCFERGWYTDADGNCYVCDRPEQAKI